MKSYIAILAICHLPRERWPRKVREKGKPPPPLEDSGRPHWGDFLFSLVQKNQPIRRRAAEFIPQIPSIRNRPAHDGHRQHRQQRSHADHAQRLSVPQEIVA
jgi:hypothetical protein